MPKLLYKLLYYTKNTLQYLLTQIYIYNTLQDMVTSNLVIACLFATLLVAFCFTTVLPVRYSNAFIYPRRLALICHSSLFCFDTYNYTTSKLISITTKRCRKVEEYIVFSKKCHWKNIDSKNYIVNAKITEKISK